MTNLEISSVCNLSCAYCFAATQMRSAQDRAQPAFIDHATLERHLDFIERSQQDSVRLIGGEPTLHPDFAHIVRRIRARGKSLVVFTNGVMRRSALDALCALSPEVCTVLVNVNASRHAEQADSRVHARRRAVMRALGDRAVVGFTIYQRDFDLHPLLALIEATNCRRQVRLGLAQPILQGENVFLHPRHYGAAGLRIVEFALEAAERGVKTAFDCGFVRCMFAPDDLARLERAGVRPAFHCSPVLDVGLDGRVAHCLPLSEVIHTPLAAFSTADALRPALARQSRAYRVAGIYPDCSTCDHKLGGRCFGGCLATTMRRFRHTSLALDLSGQPLDRGSRQSRVPCTGVTL